MIREIDYTVTTEGPDKGKEFVISRMPAFQAERWGRSFLHGATVDTPLEARAVYAGAIAEVARSVIGLNVLRSMPPAFSDPLEKDLRDCIKIKPDPERPSITRSIIDSDFEDIGTFIDLQQKAFEFNTGFFQAVSRSLPPLASDQTHQERETFSTTPTSAPSLEP
ncbi:hypothetical protein ACI01nite_26740 [Acetobacter cibinongensis]|uniref:Uncharacterized protein n=1 Tax=Acetobacter cibinongensis TaxID=146475 RepID=A0A0D6N768_9PROT|nr:hypothetical protein Abci_036_012 [Acetobacter cibinongensis]GEL60072.1 hypothetical protein ACI01nite_26740 [Acetobacter cibinongensis]